MVAANTSWQTDEMSPSGPFSNDRAPLRVDALPGHFAARDGVDIGSGGLEITGAALLLWGAVDRYLFRRAESLLARFPARSRGPLDVDAGDVTFLDSSGLRLLLMTLQHPWPITLRAASPEVRVRLEMSCVLSMFSAP